MNESLQEQVKKTYNLIVQANNQLFEIWREQIVFSWQWWLGVGLTIIPWLLWIKYRKKDSTIRLLNAGFLVIVISFWLDCVGVVLGLWYYIYEVIPFIPSYFPWDFSLLPVIIMAFIQIKPTTHPLIKGIIFSGISSFLAEPFFIWIELYQPLRWDHIYSFPIYIAIYLIADYISKRNTWAKV